jgi:hypothetical protein
MRATVATHCRNDALESGPEAAKPNRHRRLLRGNALERFEAILDLTANGGDIAIVHEIDVGVAHNMVLSDLSLQADVPRESHW